MPTPGRMHKVVGNEAIPMSNGVVVSGNHSKRPARLNYAQPTTNAPNTMRADRIEDVFIPFYDRPGYLTDNAAQQYNDGKMFEIPSGDGRIQERNLGE